MAVREACPVSRTTHVARVHTECTRRVDVGLAGVARYREGVSGMKRFRLLGLTLMAAFALSALTAVSASAALPEALGAKPFPQNWTGGNTGTETPTLETSKGERISCNKVDASGTQETDTLGKATLTILGCKTLTGNCETDGQAEGTIVSEGTYHFVDDFLGTAATLGVAVLTLVSTHFLCPFVLALVTGQLLCLVLEPLSSKVTHEGHCIIETGTKGKPLDKHWWNDSGTEQTAVLLVNKNEGAFEEAALLELASATGGEPGAFMNH
jgi:hypothetical protein